MNCALQISEYFLLLFANIVKLFCLHVFKNSTTGHQNTLEWETLM